MIVAASCISRMILLSVATHTHTPTLFLSHTHTHIHTHTHTHTHTQAKAGRQARHNNPASPMSGDSVEPQRSGGQHHKQPDDHERGNNNHYGDLYVGGGISVNGGKVCFICG